MLPKVFINWAASKACSVYKISRFFPPGWGGGVFLGIRSGGGLSAFQILTLFQTNACKANVREYPPVIFSVK